MNHNTSAAGVILLGQSRNLSSLLGDAGLHHGSAAQLHTDQLLTIEFAMPSDSALDGQCLHSSVVIASQAGAMAKPAAGCCGPWLKTCSLDRQVLFEHSTGCMTCVRLALKLNSNKTLCGSQGTKTCHVFEISNGRVMLLPYSGVPTRQSGGNLFACFGADPKGEATGNVHQTL